MTVDSLLNLLTCVGCAIVGLLVAWSVVSGRDR